MQMNALLKKSMLNRLLAYIEVHIEVAFFSAISIGSLAALIL